MVCSQCGREIADGSLSCPFCGKIFVTQRARADSLTGVEARPENAKAPNMKQAISDSSDIRVNQAVKYRRYQRWFFYALISLMFIGGVAYLVKISNDNAALVANMDMVNTKLVASQKEAMDFKANLNNSKILLSTSNASMEDLRTSLTKTNASLSQAMGDNQKLTSDIKNSKESLDKASADLLATNAILKNMLLLTGVNMSIGDLNKIPVAVSSLIGLAGMDTDKDSLIDDVEQAIGTDPLKVDTNANTYNDADELKQDYNPAGKGKMPIDKAFATKYKGKFLLQKFGTGFFAWFVSGDGQRYFLGDAMAGFTPMKASAYWTK